MVSDQSGTIRRLIVPSEQLIDTVGSICREYPVTIIVIGDRTFGKQVLQSLAALGYPVAAIDEDRSSIEGRYRYLKENSKGLVRLLPIGLRVPEQPFDDYVAEILAEWFLQQQVSQRKE